MAKSKATTYNELDRSYNNLLQRSDPPEAAVSALPNDNMPGESKPVKSGNYLDDVYLNTWIKSSFYKPHRQ